MEKQLKEAVTFFKSEKAYAKLFQAFRKKYESLGRIGGTIPIEQFTTKEVEIFSQFFGVSVEQLKRKGRIALQDFEEQLKSTRFHSVQLKEVLDYYFGETILSNKERRRANEEQLRKFLQKQNEQYPHLSFWFQHVENNEVENRFLLRLAEKDNELFARYLKLLNRAFQSLPTKAERLPIFSQRITGDPHALDVDKELGRIFLHFLVIKNDTSSTSYPQNTREINDLLEHYNLYRDDLLNFVTCANLLAEKDGQIHPVWQAAVDTNSVQLVPLRELLKIDNVRPVSGNTVWIVENSGVYSTLIDSVPHAPIICTNGQFTLASLTLIELLAQSGYTLKYSSDFDPEGLGMADRLMKKFPHVMTLWHMDQRAYYDTKPMRPLTKERLNKLKRLQNATLQEVAAEMISTEKAGYQEALIDLYIRDLKNILLH